MSIVEEIYRVVKDPSRLRVLFRGRSRDEGTKDNGQDKRSEREPDTLETWTGRRVKAGSGQINQAGTYDRKGRQNPTPPGRDLDIDG